MIIIMIIAIPTVVVVVPVVAVVVPKVAVVVAVGDLRVVHFSTHFVSVSALLLKFVAEIFQLRCLSKAKVGTKATGRGGRGKRSGGGKSLATLRLHSGSPTNAAQRGSNLRILSPPRTTVNYHTAPEIAGKPIPAHNTPHPALAYCPWIMNRTFSQCQD